MRLNKFLSAAGVASRRLADELITAGRVAVNGEAVTKLGLVIDETKDKVTVDGKPVSVPSESLYIVLNKPKGYLVTLKDDFGRQTVLDLLRSCRERVFPIGRLDKDTEGVLLLTNDGDLSYRLAHPKYGVEKVYIATVEGQVKPEIAAKIEAGVDIGTGEPAVGKAEIVSTSTAKSVVQLILKEGRKREVKRIFEALGYKVIHLKRISFAGISASGLRLGDFRYLNPKEIKTLKKKVGLIAGDSKSNGP
ncbi:MAG TPA: pseudouridine synthase [Verrucomicrobiae bacterium]|nr:pseudouridine synthase [Verrucomicrobiae bacterium]